ncbi:MULTISPECIES: response regulator [Sphingobium]|uniref:response regulator n=1 Tax=Sphingobium sp. MI1205 TaxID=407020 RepID=UPI00077046B8|nr:response regulator [Sphingobium sp. MI1205]AMK17005.1 response regulator [Sphingobium sp. MI1205]
MSKKVLIVEDEIFVALEIEQIVEDAGFSVSAIAADRESALVAAADCDIALVDLNLRDGPTGPSIGMELAAQYGVRVIYVTANPAQIGAASEAALGVITKPFRPQSIAATLRLVASNQNDLESAEIYGFTPFPPPSGSWNGMGSTG